MRVQTALAALLISVVMMCSIETGGGYAIGKPDEALRKLDVARLSKRIFVIHDPIHIESSRITGLKFLDFKIGKHPWSYSGDGESITGSKHSGSAWRGVGNWKREILGQREREQITNSTISHLVGWSEAPASQ